MPPLAGPCPRDRAPLRLASGAAARVSWPAAMPPPAPAPADAAPPPAAAARVLEYYAATAADYRTWSPGSNMHFGYYRRGMNPLRLEPMLAAMNDELIQALHLPGGRPARVLDLGCGLGATARHLARRHPQVEVTGVTVVPTQVREGNRLARAEGLGERVRVVQADYTRLPFADRSVDRAYALESACHAEGPDKPAFVRELARVLRPGGRFAILDGFMKHAEPLPAWLERVRACVCAGWAVPEFPELGAFTRTLRTCGLQPLEVRDISWNVAPSVTHVPRTMLRVLLAELRSTGALRLGRARWGNLVAPGLGVVLGLARRHFGYHLIAGRRAE